MSRPILPLPSGLSAEQRQQRAPSDPSPPPGPGPSKTTYSKRGKITIVACVSCRKRKTKCDGRRPSCSQCLAREGGCHYDMTDEQRRLTFLRDNVEHLIEEKSTLEALVQSIKAANNSDVTEIIRRLRSGTDIYSLAQQIQAGQLLTEVRGEGHPSSAPSPPYLSIPQRSRPRTRLEQYEDLLRAIANALPGELDEVLRRLRAKEDVSSILAASRSGNLLQPLPTREVDKSPGIESEYSKRDQTFGLLKGTAAHESGALHSREATNARLPDAHTPLVNHQRWTRVTDDHEFIEHLLSLYFAWQHSFFQNFPEKLFRRDMASGRTKFCSRLLVNAICAAGCLFSDRPEARRDPNDLQTAGLDFFDEAVKLLNETSGSSMPTTAALYLLCHIEGSLGRLSNLWMYCGRSARMALDVNLHLRMEKPSSGIVTPELREEEYARIHAFWGCFISDQVTSFTLGRLPQIPVTAVTIDLPRIDKDFDDEEWTAYGVHYVRRPGARSTTFNQVAALSKIVNSTLQMFFAPSTTLSGGILLEEYNKYLNWHRNLPAMVALWKDAPPHVLSLHMYYHAAVLLLFRPFLKAQFKESGVSPREVCRKSANAISDIFEEHRRLYDHVGFSTFQVHCLLTACSIHIINVPTISSTKYLTVACHNLQDLVPRNEWATSSLNIIKSLVKKWSIILPFEAEAALYRNDKALSRFDSGYGRGGGSGSSCRSNSSSQLEPFRPEKRTHFSGPSIRTIQKRQKLTPREMNQPAQYLFSPFPNQPPPLLGPIHTSTSADTKSSSEMNGAVQGFDGLDFSGDDWFDPFMGYQGEM